MDWGQVALWTGAGAVAGFVVGIALPVILMASPDAFIDIGSIIYDVYIGDYRALALDTAGLLIPGVTGLGAVSRVDEAYDAYRAVNGFDNIYDSSRNTDRLGTAYRLTDSAEYRFGGFDKGPFAQNSQQAVGLINEAANIARIDLSKYVDKVYFSPHEADPLFTVLKSGERVIVIDTASLREVKSLQLLIGSHELAHAQQFEKIVQKFNGDIFSASKYWDIKYGSGTYEGLLNYARREIVAERLAFNRVEQYFGGLPSDVVSKSINYVNNRREEINLLKRKLGL